MGKLKLLTHTAFSLDLVINSIAGLFAISIIYLMFNDRIVLSFIPTQTGTLTNIGHTIAIKGDVMRKLAKDSLYLPLYAKQKIFQDDLIVTGEDSSTEIEVGPGNFITTEPNSAIRLRIDNAGIYIQFQKGNIITHFTNEKIINIQQGVSNNQVQIRKGTYLIKNSNAGIQITAYSSRHLIKKSSTQQKSETKVGAITAGSEPESSEHENDATNKIDEKDKNEQDQKEEARKIASDHLEEQQLNTPIQLPHPNNNTVFLLKNPHKITLAAANLCLGTCQLQLFKGKQLIVDKTFTNLQIPTYDLELDENTKGSFEWIYTDNDTKFEMGFEVLPFSTAAFEKAFQEGLAIEIH